MTKRIALTIAASLLVSSAAQASPRPRLTVPQARIAVTRYLQHERAQQPRIYGCHQRSRVTVACAFSEVITEGDYSGWTYSTTAVVHLAHGRREVATQGMSGAPYIELA